MDAGCTTKRDRFQNTWSIFPPLDVPWRFSVLHVSHSFQSDFVCIDDTFRGFKFAELEMKVVLAMVVGKFKLSPADCAKDIKWELALVASPVVQGSTRGGHELPIKISKA